MEVRFCPRCGASRLPGAMYCSTCGFALSAIGPEAAEATGELAPPASGDSGGASALASLPAANGTAAMPPPRTVVPVVMIAPPPAPLARSAPAPAPAWGAPAPAAVLPGSANTSATADISATTSLDRIHARRRAVTGFARAGALLAAAGIVLPVLGVPQPAAGLAPAGSGAIVTEPLAYLPLAAIVVVVVVALTGVSSWTHDRMDAAPALATTGAAGLGVVVLAIVSAGRLGYDASGGVLPAVSLITAGGAAIIAAAIVGAMIRE